MLKFHLQQKSYLLKRLIHKVKTRWEKHNSWTMNVVIIDRWIEWSEWNLLFVFQYSVKWVSQFLSLETLFSVKHFIWYCFSIFLRHFENRQSWLNRNERSDWKEHFLDLFIKKKMILLPLIYNLIRGKKNPYEHVSETCLKWNLGLQIQARWSEVERTV